MREGGTFVSHPLFFVWHLVSEYLGYYLKTFLPHTRATEWLALLRAALNAERIRKMIILETQILFENYNKLFDFIGEMDSEVKNGKTFKSHVEFEGSSWSFVIYSPDKVASFRELAFEIEDPNFQEACEERLGLLEICTGDFKYPRYIAIRSE